MTELLNECYIGYWKKEENEVDLVTCDHRRHWEGRIVMGGSTVIGCRQKRVEELDRPMCSSEGGLRSKDWCCSSVLKLYWFTAQRTNSDVLFVHRNSQPTWSCWSKKMSCWNRKSMQEKPGKRAIFIDDSLVTQLSMLFNTWRVVNKLHWLTVF